MRIEEQVCTAEQGLKLKALGVRQESYFTWMECLLTNDGNNFNKWWAVFRPNNGEFDYMTDMTKPSDYDDYEQFETDQECAAFTVAELGEILQHFNGFVNRNAMGKWVAQIEHPNVLAHEKNKGTGTTPYSTWHKTEAEARAAMLIYLLENKLLTQS